MAEFRESVDVVPVMGVDVAAFDSYAHAVDCVADEIRAGGRSVWMAVNPEKVYRAWRDEGIRDLLGRADVRICDGIGVSIAARLLHRRRLPRCTGCDLFEALIAAAAQREWGVFLFGARPDVNAAACRKLQALHPSLRIVGRQHGYVDDDEATVRQINDSQADLLFVAMGSPAQEFWIAEHIDRLNVRFALGVGGSFDVAAGRARRAPAWTRRGGLEFLYRAVTTPGWTLRARVNRTAVKFAFAAMVARQWLTM